MVIISVQVFLHIICNTNHFIYAELNIGYNLASKEFKLWHVGTDAWKKWGKRKRGATEDEMVGWHHWLNGHEFEQTKGESKGRCEANRSNAVAGSLD